MGVDDLAPATGDMLAMRDFPPDFGMPKAIPGPRMACLPLDGDRNSFVRPDQVVVVEDAQIGGGCLVLLIGGEKFYASCTAAEAVEKLGVRL